MTRALGLADADLEAFRRNLIDEVAGPRGFDPSALSQKLDAFIKEAGKESGPRRTRASLLAVELARLFRGAVRASAGLEPDSPDTDDRRAMAEVAARIDPETAIQLAERCLEADRQIGRNAYIPLILDALAHDLGRAIPPCV